MQKADSLIRTKLHLPYLRQSLVPRPRLQEKIAQGLRGPLTLVTAPAGFGKTTLVAACVSEFGMPVAWLSLDKHDNQVERFLNYLIAALQEAEPAIGSQAAQLLEAARQAPPEAVLTGLINDLESAGKEITLVLDDYQFISSQSVHGAVAFLLEHCPRLFHLLIITRSDPPLPLSRLRACGHALELRADDLRFTAYEAAQFLNDIMGLHLDARSVAVLEERTEGWIAGLQMAALSMRDREDVTGFIAGFSGTNRYILDYLLEEVLASQPPEIQSFLLHTSILDRLTAPLCDAVVHTLERSNVSRLSSIEGEEESLSLDQRSNVFTVQRSNEILEYLERTNLFVVPLDDERTWFRYHHLFADLLRAQLPQTLEAQGITQLHLRASEWYARHGTVLEAIHHASMAADNELVERLIEQNYMEMVNRGEMSWVRAWTGELSRELVYRRPWLCIYEAHSRAWFGELDEADQLLREAEKRIRAGIPVPDAHSMLAHLTFVKSRVTAMRGDNQRAIEYCLAAREYIPAGDLAMRLDTGITLGYEYFMNGDFEHAIPLLQETIRSGIASGSVINPVAAACVLARLNAVQGWLRKSYDLYQIAAQFIPETSGQHLGARALVEAGMAEISYEWNDLEAALAHVKQGLAWLPFWGKADDTVLACITLGRIHLAQANQGEAADALEEAIHITQTSGLFSEARHAVETAQVKLWLARGDDQAAARWADATEDRLSSDDRLGFDNELARIALARVRISQAKLDKAAALLLLLEAAARSAGRMGRVIEISLLKALALWAKDDSERAFLALTECLELAAPGGYVRIFLDEGRPMQQLLARWLSHEQTHGLAPTRSGPLRDYAIHLLSYFDSEPHKELASEQKVSPRSAPPVPSRQAPFEPKFRPALVEQLSPREMEVLQLISSGRTNQEIARMLIVSPGTVKAHTSSIYRKLEVANRTEAVARARQLGILS